MMAGNVRIRLNSAGLRSILRSPAMLADVTARAHRIAAAADAASGADNGHEVEAGVGRNRARAAVITGTQDAMAAEARRRTLTAAIRAGR